MIFLENMRTKGRIIDGDKYKDEKAMGAEPCSVLTLENFELAPIVDIYIHKHKTFDEFAQTLK